MTTNHTLNTQIARNTLMLYFRMLLIMLITLYTSRIILKVLGVENFGIYNVVGGVVTMLSFLSGSLAGSTSRFITYAIGQGNNNEIKKIFQCAITVHYLLAILVFLLAETIGIWFLENKLVIPPSKMIAANWVYQCSIITILINIISTPYNSLIIAYEKMNAFAYISIYESCAKLLVAIGIFHINADKLIIYAIMLLIVQISIRLIYIIYCKKVFSITKISFLWDTNKSKQILTFSAWTLNGSLAVMGYTQGINILLNLFFGPVVNAARAIAVQVQNAIIMFFNNFQVAITPQITKSYARGDLRYMHQLIIYSSKFSFFICLIIAFPILINIDYILKLWLITVPVHTQSFVAIMILAAMDNSLSQPVSIAIHATGRIKKFQIIEGTLLLSIVPIAYINLKIFRIPPEMVLWIYLMIEIFTQFVRVWIVFPEIKMKISFYFTKILFPIIVTSIPLIFIYLFANKNKPIDFTSFMYQASIELVISITSVYLFGLKRQERKYIKNLIQNKFFKK